MWFESTNRHFADMEHLMDFAEMEEIMSEDPGDRADRLAHGFTYEDDWQDESLLCRNGCGLPYPEVVAGKIRNCNATISN